MNITEGVTEVADITPIDHLTRWIESMVGNRDWKETLTHASTILMTCNLVLLMFGMGAATSIIEVWDNVKKPCGCFIGLICQFILLPAFGFCTCQLLNLPAHQSLGVIILTCSPGGAFSNFFTYWMGGDLAMSIIMTATSLLFAFGGMPLNLWIYGRFWTNEKLVIPYVNVVISMAFATGPALIGMGIRHGTRKWANRIARLCGILGWFGAITSGVFLTYVYWETLKNTQIEMILAAAIIPAVGFTTSYLLAKFFCMSHKLCCTIGIETSCQNLVVALNVVLLSFSDSQTKGEMVMYPAVYGIFQIVEAFILVTIYQIYKFIHRDDVTEEKVKSVIDNSILTRVHVPNHTSFNSLMAQSNRQYELMQREYYQPEAHLVHRSVLQKNPSETEHFLKSLQFYANSPSIPEETDYISISEQPTLQLPCHPSKPRLILTDHPVHYVNNVYSTTPTTPRSPSANFGYEFNTFATRD